MTLYLLPLSPGRSELLCASHLRKGPSELLSAMDLAQLEIDTGVVPACEVCGREPSDTMEDR